MHKNTIIIISQDYKLTKKTFESHDQFTKYSNELKLMEVQTRGLNEKCFCSFAPTQNHGKIIYMYTKEIKPWDTNYGPRRRLHVSTFCHLSQDVRKKNTKIFLPLRYTFCLSEVRKFTLFIPNIFVPGNLYYKF